MASRPSIGRLPEFDLDITQFKIVAAATVFLVGLSGGLLAQRLSASRSRDMLFSLGNAFAGGVFLGAGLIHMLPDAQAGFADLLPHSQYPYFAVVCILGFLLILFLERVLLHNDDNVLEQASGKKSRGRLFPYILLLTLSIHSVITGIALGTEDRVVQAMVILIAVLAHKGTASFALTTNLLRTRPRSTRTSAIIAFFAATTPVGILLGWWFMEVLSGRAEMAFEAVFDGLAAGTFIYIAAVDILEGEFSAKESNTLKFGSVVAGFGLMALVAIWT